MLRFQLQFLPLLGPLALTGDIVLSRLSDSS